MVVHTKSLRWATITGEEWKGSKREARVLGGKKRMMVAWQVCLEGFTFEYARAFSLPRKLSHQPHGKGGTCDERRCEEQECEMQEQAKKELQRRFGVDR